MKELMTIDNDQKTNKKLLTEAYEFFKDSGINDRSYHFLKTDWSKKYGTNSRNAVEMMLEIGMYAETLRDMDNARKIYYLSASEAYSMDFDIRKNIFVKCVLKLSKLEYMRGISPAETLELQRKAIDMVTQSNITGEDALLFLYAGMGEHFGGELERGEILRTKGIKYLKEFNYLDMESEAVPLMIWHYYLSGDLKKTVGYYENYMIPIENRRNEEIIIMAYPAVVFSYFLMGEYSRALVLCENIYKKASRMNDRIAANLMFAISGRIRVYMGDMVNAENILYDAYAEARELKYGWGLYYALFGICFFQYQKENYEASREAMVLARKAAKEYGFFPINASPFLLDVMKAIRDNKLEPVEDFDYEERLKTLSSSNNKHLKGVSYRHIAMEMREHGGDVTKIKEDLKTSIELLELSGNRKELYQSCVALAEVYLNEGDEENSEIYANRAWNLLSHNERVDFPNKLFILVADRQSTVSFFNQLETTWLELRHIINEERMLARLLTSMCRLLKAECGAFMAKGQNGFEIKLSQNVENTLEGTIQMNRIQRVASMVAQTGKLDVNYVFGKAVADATENDEKIPKYSVGIPFLNGGRTFAVLYVESFYVNDPLSDEEIELISEFSRKMSEPLFAVLNYERMTSEGAVIEDEEEKNERPPQVKNGRFCGSIDPEVNFIMSQIEKVAETNIPVLIIGETGVGKEVFARAVYEQSDYKKTFIKVNCGAIPESLIESELFGYEKGSFTGAGQRKKGYFELAEGGTIFLDEIGELSLMAQVKLLRVLQEHEFMRVGGSSTIKVDFRLIAATNKDLKTEVENGSFRKDLYYRLNVVQFTVPPLRNRKDDILNFTNFFIGKYCAEQGKPLCQINESTKKKLLAYDWPGNVREMENVIQKGVLFSNNGRIEIELQRDVYAAGEVGEELTSNSKEIRYDESHEASTFKKQNEEIHTGKVNVLDVDSDASLFKELSTLEEMERKYITYVLEQCGGRLSGKGGAAEILGLKRTTLISKMQKLGLRK